MKEEEGSQDGRERRQKEGKKNKGRKDGNKGWMEEEERRPKKLGVSQVSLFAEVMRSRTPLMDGEW